MEAAASSKTAPPDIPVVATAELERRASRPAQHALENEALLRLMDALAAQPDSILDVLADTILEVCGAGSAGISLAGGQAPAEAVQPAAPSAPYRWRAVSGALRSGGDRAEAIQPHRLSRWTIELDPGGVQLFVRPGRCFPKSTHSPHRSRKC